MPNPKDNDVNIQATPIAGEQVQAWPEHSATERRPQLRRLIAGDLVTLREFTLEDADQVFEAAYSSRAEIARWLPWCHANYRREETVAYLSSLPAAWASSAEFSFAIIENATGRFVGGCGINQLDWLHLRANLGYWIRTDAAGRGLATAAVLALAPAALEDLDLERVEIWAAVDNLPSRRVAEKCGAKLEAVARRRLRMRDHQQDAAGYAFVRSDFGLRPRRGQ